MKTEFLLGLTIIASSSAFAKKALENQPLNFVLLLADDISINDFGCYGNKDVKTPNIDKLANSGMRFNNMYLTISSSSPSRSSIITGRYPHNTGACELHTAMGEEQVFFPEILKDGGYYTAQAGKWHLGGTSRGHTGPVVRAFDRVGGDKFSGGGESGSEKWIETLQERPKDKPFFMWFASHDAHRNWDDEIFLKRHHPDKIAVFPAVMDDEVSRDDIARYYDEVARFDYYVGQVIKELKKQKVYDRTCIMIMADNGRPFPRAKSRLIDDGIKTPPDFRTGTPKIKN